MMLANQISAKRNRYIYITITIHSIGKLPDNKSARLIKKEKKRYKKEQEQVLLRLDNGDIRSCVHCNTPETQTPLKELMCKHFVCLQCVFKHQFINDQKILYRCIKCKIENNLRE